MTDFDVQVLRSDSRAVVYVRGELDASTAALFRGSLAELVGAGARHIVVDLRDLSFMGASGLGVLVGVARRLRRGDGKLTVRSPRPGVLRTIEMTGVDRVVPVSMPPARS